MKQLVRKSILLIFVAAIGAAIIYGMWPAPVEADLAKVVRGSIRETVDQDGKTPSASVTSSPPRWPVGYYESASTPATACQPAKHCWRPSNHAIPTCSTPVRSSKLRPM